MKDEAILDLLKKSKAFTERFPQNIQQKMLEKFPNLEPAKKLKIVQILVKESEELEKIYTERTKILEEYKAILEDLVRRGGRSMKTAIENAERDQAMKEVDAQLNKI